MPRLVRLEATGPLKIDPSALPRNEQGNLRAISICACGLSRTFPICDGAHKPCRVNEQPGVLHIYDRDRVRIIDQRPDV